MRSAAGSMRSGCVFDLAGIEREIAELDQRSGEPDFWNESQTAQATMRRLGELRARVGVWKELRDAADELASLAELADEDPRLADEVAAETAKLAERLDDLEF